MTPSMTPATAVPNAVVRCSIDPCDGRHIDGWRRHIDLSSNRCDYDRSDRCDENTFSCFLGLPIAALFALEP